MLRRISQLGEAIIHVAGPERTMAALRATITAQRMLDAQEESHVLCSTKICPTDVPRVVSHNVPHVFSRLGGL